MQDLGVAWIQTVPEDFWNKDKKLAKLHPKVVDPVHARVDNILAIHSLNPRGMSAHQSLYESAMHETSTLPKVERELIALIVSLENDCHY